MIYPDRNNLGNLLSRLRARRRLLMVLRGLAIVLAAGAAILLLTGWAAHRYRHNDNALLFLRLGALITFLTTLCLALVRPLWKRITDTRLARLIEEHHPVAEDRLVTAIECSSPERDPNISKAILQRLEADANQLAGRLSLGKVIRRSRLLLYGGATVASLIILAGVLRWGPREISEGVAQLVMPKTLAASTSAMSIRVKPGSARVPRSSDQDVLATLVNFDAQIVSIYWRPVGSKDDWKGQAMEPAKAKTDYRYSIFNIQDSIEYFVESDGVRSDTYKLAVVDLPYVKQLDVTLNFPSFSHLPSKTTEDGGDIAALKGTVATITARLSGKVRAARIVLADGKKIEMRANGQDWVGDLTVSGETSYYIELVSVDGETYRGSNEYDVSVLEDLPPTVSFERPGRDRKATNLEEVFTQARAEDDYGVVGMDLYFSVNGGDEKKVNLQELTRESARTLTATHTFFLEEFNLKPGDFISYYAKARDANSETTSDIYFIEVKPFEMEYRQSQQQGGGGGGGQQGDQDQNALSRRQKDLIAATHKLIRESDKYTPQERKDGYEAVAAGQEKLRTDTLEFLDRMGRRLPDELAGQKEMAEMASDLKQAAEEMKGAPPPLRNESGRDALPPEQRALQKLLAADAIFRQVQVAFGNQNANGGGGQSSQRQQQELAGLFELELDKMKNQYETVQRQQRQQAQQQKSEAARRLEELARRQEQALEEQRRRLQGPRNQSGSSGGNQRQQQELIDETRRAARELERLSRERRDAQMQELSRQLNQTADQMQKAQASSRGNSSESIAQNERALDRLREAQTRLQQMNGQSGGQSGASGRQKQISDLRQRAAQAASRQREIAKDVENLARRGGQDANSQRAREQLAERKDALADAVSGLQQDIEQSARAMGGGQQRTARQLNDAAEGMARDRIAERIREGKQALNGNNLEGARANERAVERSLNNLSERLQSAEQGAGQSGNNAEEALDRTRQLADNVDSLRRRLDENAARRNGNSQGQQRGQQQGQQQGQQGQSGQQQGGQRGQQGQQGNSGNGSNSGDGRQGGSYDRGGGYGGWDDRQLNSELRQRLNDAQKLRQQLGGTSGPYLDRAIDQLRRLTEVGTGHDIQTAAQLKDSVIDPLRQLELQLSRQAQNQAGRTNLRLHDEGAAPERYRKAVEEYYRRLSGGGRKQ
ncbi:MAG: hypothetical protein AUJ04_02965 [Acidobacteria bacterium 13_1_40CM_3_55_6]|nr:MAG: hypothetical protein AUJ04_02965 [Acidobacteria bacterium 13_1_40CM_3_55_6]